MHLPLKDDIMNEALNISPGNAIDTDYLSTLRRLRGDVPAANEDLVVQLPAIDDIVAWARHVSGKADLGDPSPAYPLTVSRGTALELQQDARYARSRAIADVIAAALASMHAALRRALAKYRAYRNAQETAQALRGLDDRTLHDLGYHRSEIESVAIEVSIERAR